MADGLKQHTHEERSCIVERLVPLIKRHMGSELLALAATGSFARGTDGAYSDVELMGFVKRRPDSDRASVKFIYDGVLIDLWFLTRVDYLYIHRQKIGAEWPYAGRNMLVPLLNEPFIREVADVPLNMTLEERMRALGNYWPEVQEATAKVLTASSREDDDSSRFLFWQMSEKMCVALSLVNGRPFTTRAAIFSEVRMFRTLPMHIELLSIPPDSQPTPADMAERAMIVFEEIEQILYSYGLDLYAKSLESFVSPLSVGKKIRRRLKIGNRVRNAVRIISSTRSRLLGAH